jgi:hypothetical protein
MAWIGPSRGLFRLHDSDGHCGSFLSVTDAAEVLETSSEAFSGLKRWTVDGLEVISELELHRAWGAGTIDTPEKPRIGNAIRSLDEIILRKLIQITLPGAQVECQVPFGRKRVDLCVTRPGQPAVLIEFLGPSHFISQFQREPRPPSDRKREIEDHFSAECVLWPYWIQRCSSSVRAIFEPEAVGFASVWSTRAFFGDFTAPDSASTIVGMTNRFKAMRTNGIGYMYGNTHTRKPVHPIIASIHAGKATKAQLIPKGTDQPPTFWLPEEIC